jgi:hypothetical protein
MSEDYSLIPDRVMNNLLQYVEGNEAPGGFLFAVLSNNLFESIGRADNEMQPLIPLLVKFISWKIPYGCHGSPDIVKAWMEKKYKEKTERLK